MSTNNYNYSLDTIASATAEASVDAMIELLVPVRILI